jgi:hypothetical protein
MVKYFEYAQMFLRFPKTGGEVRDCCENEGNDEVKECNMLIILGILGKIGQLGSDSRNPLKSLKNFNNVNNLNNLNNFE